MHPYKIAIIGLGPKGLYAFERLLARLQKSGGIKNVEIHLFEKTGNFGAGEIYDTKQPEYLIMNYPNRNINAWSNEEPSSFVPETLDFVDWLRKYENQNGEHLANGFSPRRLVGKYLGNCFDILLTHKRDDLKVFLHTAEVRDIEKIGQKLVLKYNTQGEQLSTKLIAKEVLLTTGHSSCKGRLEVAENSTAANDSNFIPFVYPVEEKLANVRKNSTIGIKGLGLTFVDTVLALTEGRGGKFEIMQNGNLLYIPSGNEPNRIFAFSRCGLPMIPRSGGEGEKPYEPRYFTSDNIRARAGESNNISFIEHVLPLFIAEMQYRYYSIIFEQQNLSFYPDRDIKGLKSQIHAFHEKYPEVYRLNFSDISKSKPFEGPAIELGGLAYLRYILKEAEKGSETSPFMAAAMTWGRLSETFNSIYSFGGMTADSHYIFDKKYRSKLNRISYGPPVENMKKIMTLVETGIVNLEFAKNPEVKKLQQGWALYNSSLKFQKIDTLVDARIPAINSKEDWSPLFTNLRKRGLLRPYRIQAGLSYEVGCPDVDNDGKAIDRNGTTISNISLYGTPTEGIVYDNDTLSRARNNFASQWAVNVVENFSKGRQGLKKENTHNG